MSEGGESKLENPSSSSSSDNEPAVNPEKRFCGSKVATTVYGHKGCNDGHLAAALYVLGLLFANHEIENIEIRFLTASMVGFEVPVRAEHDEDGHVRHAVFVDLSPTVEHEKQLEAYYDQISVFDHHISSAAFLQSKSSHPKWFVQHSLTCCGSSMVFDHFFRFEKYIDVCGADVPISEVQSVVERTDAYDTWKSPTPEIFRFATATRVVWSQCTQPRVPTTVEQLLSYFKRICALHPNEIEDMTHEWWAAIQFEYKVASKFVVELPTTTGEKLRALTWFGDAVTNQSIVAHMILNTHQDFEVAMCLFRKNENGGIVYQASLRSRSIDITSKLDWARGHAQACGGMLPKNVVQTFVC